MSDGDDAATGSPPRKILSVVHYPIFGGPHNQALRLNAPLRRAGTTTLVVLPDEPGNAGMRLRSGGVDVVEISLHRLRARLDPYLQVRAARAFGREVGRLRALIRRHEIDVVQLNGLVNPHAAIAARLESVAVVWQILDTRAPMLARRALLPVVTHLADVVMTTGLRTARQHPGLTGMGARLVPFLPPVDTETFIPDEARRRHAREELGLEPGTVVIGALANLNPQKGHEHLIRAVAGVRGSGRSVELRILGARTPTHEAYARSLEREIAALGVGDPARVLRDPGGAVEEWLPGLDVFALAAVPRSEGVPTAMLEAMSCGVAPVVTDVGGVRDAITEGDDGFVVEPGDGASLERALTALVDSPVLRSEIGGRARATAVARFDSETCARSHLHAYELAMAARRVPDGAT